MPTVSSVTATTTTEIYTLSLHDALPILRLQNKSILVTGSTTGIGEAIARRAIAEGARVIVHGRDEERGRADRKSTRLNSSHVEISYAVFCLKKKTQRCLVRALEPSRPSS